MVRFGRAKQREDYEIIDTPGPKYWVRELFGKDSKKIGFTKASRPELHSTNTETPLGKYTLPETGKVTREISFGGAPRFESSLQSRIDPVGTPGPLETSTVSAFKFHVDTPLYSFQGRNKEVARYMGKYLSVPLADAPPPGLYFNEEIFSNPRIDSTKRKPIEVKFPKAKKDFDPSTASKTTPGPVYEIRDTLNSKYPRFPTAHFGTTTRPPLYNLYAAEFPGPSYNPSYKLVMKNDAHGVIWKKKTKIDKKAIHTPGPGQYKWDKLGQRVPNVRMLGKWKETPIPVNAPDPTKYSKRTVIGEDAPKISFSKQGLPIEDLSKPRIKLTGKGYKRIYLGKALNPQEPDPSIPDAGKYTPLYDSTFLSRNKRSPSVSFGPPRCRTPSARKSTRGSVDRAESASTRMSSKRRPQSTSVIRSTPGPGQYDIIPGLRSLSQSRRTSSVKWIPPEKPDKSNSPGKDSPGPKYKPNLDRFSGVLFDLSKGGRFGGLQ